MLKEPHSWWCLSSTSKTIDVSLTSRFILSFPPEPGSALKAGSLWLPSILSWVPVDVAGASWPLLSDGDTGAELSTALYIGQWTTAKMAKRTSCYLACTLSFSQRSARSCSSTDSRANPMLFLSLAFAMLTAVFTRLRKTSLALDLSFIASRRLISLTVFGAVEQDP